MTITELIAALEAIRAEHGNLDVVCNDYPETLVPAKPPQVLTDVYRHPVAGYKLEQQLGHYEGDTWVPTAGLPAKVVLL